MFTTKVEFINFLTYVKGVLIDLDGTLLELGVDWESLRRSFHQLYESTYHSPLPVKRFMEIFGYIKQKHGEIALQPFIDRQREQETLAIISPKTIPLWLMKEGLTILGSIIPQSAIMVVISNNFHNTISKVLDRFSVKYRFQSIIGQDDVKEAKPNPEGLLRIVKLYNLSEKECIFIGNHETDEMAAKSAQIPYKDVGELQVLFS